MHTILNDSQFKWKTKLRMKNSQVRIGMAYFFVHSKIPNYSKWCSKNKQNTSTVVTKKINLQLCASFNICVFRFLSRCGHTASSDSFNLSYDFICGLNVFLTVRHYQYHRTHTRTLARNHSQPHSNTCMHTFYIYIYVFYAYMRMHQHVRCTRKHTQHIKRNFFLLKLTQTVAFY